MPSPIAQLGARARRAAAPARRRRRRPRPRPRSPCSARRPSRRRRRSSASDRLRRGRRRASRPCGSWRRRAPARACRAPRRARRCSCAIGVEPTKLTAAHLRMLEQRVDRVLVALHDVEHAVGQAGLARAARASSSDARRIALATASARSVLPQAIAIGNIHIGTIAGKLNGVMPAHTPSGWRSDQLSMPVPTWSVNSPFSSCGMPQANSTTSMPRVTSPCASRSTLPCSCGDERRERVALPVEQRQERGQHAGAAQRRRVRPAGQARCALATAAFASSDGGERHLAHHRAGGWIEYRQPRAAPGHGRAADPVTDEVWAARRRGRLGKGGDGHRSSS